MGCAEGKAVLLLLEDYSCFSKTERELSTCCSVSRWSPQAICDALFAAKAFSDRAPVDVYPSCRCSPDDLPLDPFRCRMSKVKFGADGNHHKKSDIEKQSLGTGIGDGTNLAASRLSTVVGHSSLYCRCCCSIARMTATRRRPENIEMYCTFFNLPSTGKTSDAFCSNILVTRRRLKVLGVYLVVI